MPLKIVPQEPLRFKALLEGLIDSYRVELRDMRAQTLALQGKVPEETYQLLLRLTEPTTELSLAINRAMRQVQDVTILQEAPRAKT